MVIGNFYNLFSVFGEYHNFIGKIRKMSIKPKIIMEIWKIEFDQLTPLDHTSLYPREQEGIDIGVRKEKGKVCNIRMGLWDNYQPFFVGSKL